MCAKVIFKRGDTFAYRCLRHGKSLSCRGETLGLEHCNEHFQVFEFSHFSHLSSKHSFTQEACFETTLLLLYKSNTLRNEDLSSLRATHPLYDHLYLMYK